MKGKQYGTPMRRGTMTFKPTLRLTTAAYEEMLAEGARIERSLSWILERAWHIAKAEIAKQPTMADDE